MQTISATQAKQKFSEALGQAENQPVAIQRHGKIVAMMVPPVFVSNDQSERRLARMQQEKVESDRLIRHQRVAIRLLKEPEQASKLVRDASQVVDRWERESLCSHHFIGRWRELLSLPVGSLAETMCGDLDGWGKALRQNSPWPVSL
ncbi:MAG TPA: type II toxin-antitoxin system Phd/YefM family antitoxin [Nevskia sp.]|nr:type II toxin-antitoxin system Phd/YefM family antitoxin [Nevskia sp.]